MLLPVLPHTLENHNMKEWTSMDHLIGTSQPSKPDYFRFFFGLYLETSGHMTPLDTDHMDIWNDKSVQMDSELPKVFSRDHGTKNAADIPNESDWPNYKHKGTFTCHIQFQRMALITFPVISCILMYIIHSGLSNFGRVFHHVTLATCTQTAGLLLASTLCLKEVREPRNIKHLWTSKN